MPRFRARPIDVNAVQLRWNTWDQMCTHADVGLIEDGRPQGGFALPDGTDFHPTPRTNEHIMAMAIPTPEGTMVAVEKSWVVRGTEGELYPVKDSIFRRKYEALDDEGLYAFAGPIGDLREVPLTQTGGNASVYTRQDKGRVDTAAQEAVEAPRLHDERKDETGPLPGGVKQSVAEAIAEHNAEVA